MGELPPLHTPQGPDVPRALRPGFPRVDSSGTSRVPSSRSASFPFLSSGSLQFSPVFSTVRYRFLHGSLRSCSLVFPSASFPFLPLPCVQFSPVLSTSFLTPLPGSFSSPFHAYLLGIVPLPRFWFSPLPVRFRFSSTSSPLPPVSFPFLPLPFVQFSPVLSTLVLFGSPVVFPPTWRSDFFPVLLPDPGFRRRSLAARFLWPAGRAEAPPHHSREAAKSTGTGGIHKPISEPVQSTGNEGLK